MQLLHNQPHKSVGLELFSELSDWLAQLGTAHLMNAYGFCPLPMQSYHVTVWDGLSEKQVPEVNSHFQPQVGQFLSKLPESLSTRHTFMEDVSTGQLLVKDYWEIRFRFSHLTFWSSKGLAAVLEPVDEHSRHLLEQLRSGRENLSADFSDRLQFHHEADHYVPHITLGYFLNPELAGRISPQVEIAHWGRQVAERCKDLTLTMTSIGLYAYTDMVSFFRIGAPG
ncbi:MAG: hypothetical protein NWR72_09100 [Bacteroidia bacterium]|nr:hypothetical protein [Bacteroidia bacterium]